MLILRLQSPDDQAFVYTVLGSNALSAEWEQGDWASAVKRAGGQPVVLLVPTRDVLLTRTLLPTTNARLLKQALPFALEESLVGDPEDQHFVWQGSSDSGELDVAVIERVRLREWMGVLKQHKLRARAILPDVFVLPWSSEMPTIWQRHGQVWVRHGVVSGFSCPADALPLLIDELYDSEDQTRAVRLYADEARDWQDKLSVTPETQPNLLLQNSIQSAMGLNLLNGYQDESMSSFTRHWKRWRVAAAIALFALGVAVGIQGVETRRLAQQLEADEQRNMALFKEVFPGVNGVTAQDIRSRVKSELRRMEGEITQASTKSSFLPYMSTVAKAFQQAQVLKVTEIRSRSDKLTIVFEAPDLQVLEPLGKELTAALGYEVVIKSTQANNVVRAELTLEMKS